MSVVAQRLREIQLERTLPPQRSEPPGPRFSPTAALRLWDALNDAYFAEPSSPEPQTEAKPAEERAAPPERAWRPLDDLRIQDTVRMRVTAYCAYVGSLITAQGVASATRISRKQAQHHLTELYRSGKLYPRPLYGRRVGGLNFVWEWVGEGA